MHSWYWWFSDFKKIYIHYHITKVSYTYSLDCSPLFTFIILLIFWQRTNTFITTSIGFLTNTFLIVNLDSNSLWVIIWWLNKAYIHYHLRCCLIHTLLSSLHSDPFTSIFGDYMLEKKCCHLKLHPLTSSTFLLSFLLLSLRPSCLPLPLHLYLAIIWLLKEHTHTLLSQSVFSHAHQTHVLC